MPGPIPVADHKGSVYRSFRALAKAYSIDVKVLRGRVNRGWDLKEALTLPIHERHSGACEDHLGNIYPDQKAMCMAYGVQYHLFRGRMKAGWTLEAALTSPTTVSKPVYDHMGQEYPSMNAMAKVYGLTSATLQYRLSGGLTLEEALTKPVEDFSVKDINGVEHKSMRAMALAHGINYKTFLGRKERGEELVKALSPEALYHKKEVSVADDQLTIDELCKKYHIARTTYYSRIANNIPLDKPNKIQPAVDHRGLEYPSITAICRHYKVNRATFQYRLDHGWTLRESLLGRKRRKQPEKKDLAESRKRRIVAEHDIYREHLEMLEQNKTGKDDGHGKEKV